MDHSLYFAARKKKARKSFLIFSVALVLVYAFVFTTVNILITSDALMARSILPVLWGIVMDLSNFLFYWIAFAFLILFGFSYDRKTKGFWISYVAVVLVRYLLNQLASSLLLGFYSINDFLSDSLPFILIDIVMDLLQALVAFLIVRKLAQFSKEELTAHIPSDRLFDLSNPILKTAFWVSVIPAAVRILSRLIYDLFIGIPKSFGDLLWMVTYYLFDLLSFLVGYFVILFCLNRFALKEQRASAEYNASILKNED